MPKRTIWFAASSVVVYHLDRNCQALKNANDVLQSEDINLNPDRASPDITMRLCGFCEDKYNRGPGLWDSVTKIFGTG